MTLDGIDCRIISLLQKEGRISNQQLADQVALSPSACLRRLRALEESGVILGYQAIVDPALLGQRFEAIVQVSLDQTQPGWHESFMAQLQVWPEVHEASIVTGASNYVLQVKTADLEAFSNFVVDKLNQTPGVRDICSHIVMRKVKSPLRPARA